jgi:rubredoxin
MAKLIKQTISARLDPEVSAFVEEERLNKGIYKSSAYNELLKELMLLKKKGMKLTDISGETVQMANINPIPLEKEKIPEKIPEKIELPKIELPKIESIQQLETIKNLETIKALQNEVRNNEKLFERTESLKKSIDPIIVSDVKPIIIPDVKPIIIPNVKPVVIPDVKPVVIPDLKVLDKMQVNTNITTIPNSNFKVEVPKIIERILENPGNIHTTINPVNNLGDLIKLTNNTIPPIKSNDNKIIKPKSMESKRMNEEINSVKQESTEEAIKRYMDKQKFNQNISEMHSKIQNIDDRVCKDGECTRNEFADLKKNVASLNDLKTSLGKDLSKLQELDDLKKDLVEIKGKLKKTEICPGCGYTDVPHLSSYCPDCGIEFQGWDDQKDWKPYKERNRK